MDKKIIHPLFLFSILLLMVNDFLLKSMFHNAITGKLSDFAWLFAMPFFLSIFNQKHARNIHLLVGLFFIFWKSELSKPVINALNSFGFGFHRVVDFSDNVALLSVLVSYFVFQKQDSKTIQPVFGVLAIAISSFAFVADTQERPPMDEYYYVEDPESSVKYIQLKNISNQTKIAIINFKYSEKELKNSSIVYKNFNKIDTLRMKKDTIINFYTPICEDDKTRFPKNFSVVIKDSLGNPIANYSKQDFLEYEKNSELGKNQKECNLNYWCLEIGFQKDYVSLYSLKGKWRVYAGKNHHDFQLNQNYYHYDHAKSEGTFPYIYNKNILSINFFDVGKVIRLKNDSLTINWNNKDVVKYERW
jgi:hypothetical protein